MRQSRMLNKIIEFVVLTLVVFLCSALARGTTVTGTTVSSGDGQLLTNARITAEFVSKQGTFGSPVIPSVSTVTDINGTFTMTLTDVNTINPRGGTWKFTVCPNATVTCTIIPGVTITGTTQEIGGLITSNIPTLSVNAQTLVPKAYNDAEVPVVDLTNIGAMYWNSLTKAPRFWDGSAWTQMPLLNGTNLWTGLNASTDPAIDVRAVSANPTQVCNGVRDDTADFITAITLANTLAVGSASSGCRGIKVPAGVCQEHDVDTTTLGGTCVYLFTSHPGESFINYNGAGGAGTYNFKFTNLSFGGSSGIRYFGAGTVGVAESALYIPGVIDALGIIEYNSFAAYFGTPLKMGVPINSYIYHNRFDANGGYAVSFLGNNTGNGNPIHFIDNTLDNNIGNLSSTVRTLMSAYGYDGTHWGLGVIFCDSCTGANLKVDSNRFEFNVPLINIGNADNAIVYEQNTTGSMKASFSNVVVQGQSASKMLLTSSTTNKIISHFSDGTDVTQNVLGLAKNRTTNIIIGTRHDTLGLGVTLNGNIQQFRGFNIEDQAFDNIGNAFVGTSVRRFNCGDILFRAGEYTPGTNGAFRQVKSPCPGYSFGQALTVTTTAITTAANAVITNVSPQANDVRINDNLVYNGTSGIVTAVDYVAGTITVNPAPAASANPATITRQVLALKDLGMDAGRSNTTPPATGTHNRGEVFWNSVPTLSGIAGWVCVTAGTPCASWTPIITGDVNAKIALNTQIAGTLAVANGGTGQISLSSGTGINTKRVAGCATAASVGATCDTTVTAWGTSFADTNYTISCVGSGITSGVPLNGGVVTKGTTQAVFRTVAATAVAAQYTNIECVGRHD